MVLSELFEPTNLHRKEYFWTATNIQKEIAKHVKSKDVPNLTNLGKALKKLKWTRFKNKNDRGYYLRLRMGGAA